MSGYLQALNYGILHYGLAGNWRMVEILRGMAEMERQQLGYGSRS